MNTTDIKLSDKQKEVIKLMRNGGLLSKSYKNNKFYINPFSSCEDVVQIDGRVINGLEIKDIIRRGGYKIYELTNKSKTIQL